MFKTKYVIALEKQVAELQKLHKVMEEYFGIEYFEGIKQKPHYRKRRAVIKKVRRPRKHHAQDQHLHQ